MLRRLSCTALLLFAMAAATMQARAADVTGKWKGPLGDTGSDVEFVLKSDGANVTGTMTDSEGKPRPITKGSFADGRISLTVASEYSGNPITLLVTGTVEGDTMTLKVQTEDGAWGTDAVVKRSA